MGQWLEDILDLKAFAGLATVARGVPIRKTDNSGWDLRQPVLADHSDLSLTSWSNGQTLVYNVISGKVENRALTASDVGAAAASHTHAASDIVSGTLGVTRGGTGLSSINANEILYGSGTNTISALAANGTTTNKALISNSLQGVRWVDFASYSLIDGVSLAYLANSNSFSGTNSYSALNTFSAGIDVRQSADGAVAIAGRRFTNTNGGTGFLIKFTDATPSATLFSVDTRGRGVLASLDLTDSGANVSGQRVDAGNNTNINNSLPAFRYKNYYTTSSSGSAFLIAPQWDGGGSASRVLDVAPTINHSGTAGFSILRVSPYLQATGSGTKLLLDVGTNSAADGGGTHTSLLQTLSTGATRVYDPASSSSYTEISSANSGAWFWVKTVQADLVLEAANSNKAIHFRTAGTDRGKIDDSTGGGWSITPGTDSSGAGGAPVALTIARTYTQSSTAGSTDLKIVRTETTLGSGNHRFLDFYAGASGTTSVFYLKNDGAVRAAGTSNFDYVQVEGQINCYNIYDRNDSYARCSLTTDSTHGWQWLSRSNTIVPVSVKKKTGQTADLFQALDTDGSTLLWSIANDGHTRWSTDTGLTRSAAGVLKATNGSSGFGDIAVNFLRTSNIFDAALYTSSGSPLKWMIVKDTAGTQYWIPAYAASQITAN